MTFNGRPMIFPWTGPVVLDQVNVAEFCQLAQVLRADCQPAAIIYDGHGGHLLILFLTPHDHPGGCTAVHSGPEAMITQAVRSAIGLKSCREPLALIGYVQAAPAYRAT